MVAQLSYTNNPQDMLDNALWTNETKEEMFGHNLQPNTTYHKHLVPTVQHGGGGVMIWA